MLPFSNSSTAFMHFMSPVLHVVLDSAVPTRCGLPQLWKQELPSQRADETHTAFHAPLGRWPQQGGWQQLISGRKYEFLNCLTIA